ncbi:MAG: hypothetical protein A2284_12605 [Deltaproteobacteria bacterium RIFOXYA12_FULL_61_11]|nr:MAG: hypothetical protein A2284_12605 [Deltaproteobacteria bacterium RIFOXYA12_FULL_61_11]
MTDQRFPAGGTLVLLLMVLGCTIAPEKDDTQVPMSISVHSRPVLNPDGRSGSAIEVELEGGSKLILNGSEMARMPSITITRKDYQKFSDNAEELGYGLEAFTAAEPIYIIHASIVAEDQPLDFSEAGLTHHIPLGALPSNAIPSNTWPASLLSEADMPQQAIPSNAIPSNALPSSHLPDPATTQKALPSNALPSNALPSSLWLAPPDLGDAVFAPALKNLFQVPDHVVVPLLLGRIDGAYSASVRCHFPSMARLDTTDLLAVTCPLEGKAQRLDFDFSLFAVTASDYFTLRLNQIPLVFARNHLDLNNPNGNRAPVIQTQDRSIPRGGSIQIEAEDPDGDFLVAFVEGLPPGAYQSFQHVIFPTDAALDAHRLTITVLDGGNPQRATRKTLTVTVVGETPEGQLPPSTVEPSPPDPSIEEPVDPPPPNATLPYLAPQPKLWTSVAAGSIDYQFGDETRAISGNAFFLQERLVEVWEFVEFLRLKGSRNAADNPYLTAVANDQVQLQVDGTVTLVSPETVAKPMFGVTWHGARDYCRFLGGELPSDLQWRLAVTQKKTAFLPSTGSVAETTIWEWTLDLDDTQALEQCLDPSTDCTDLVVGPDVEGGMRVLRGGDWTAATFPDRRILSAESALIHAGFRCAGAAPGSDMTCDPLRNGTLRPCRTYCTTAAGQGIEYSTEPGPNLELGCPSGLFCCYGGQAVTDGGWCPTECGCGRTTDTAGRACP